jgi:hypothetical protein
MKPRGKSKRAGCVICGSHRNLQWHHIGGKKHLAWVMMPLCHPHHAQCHRLIKGIDLQYTSDPVERLIRASIAISIFLCIVQEALREATLSQPK